MKRTSKIALTSSVVVAGASLLVFCAAPRPAIADGAPGISQYGGETPFNYTLTTQLGFTGVAIARGDYEYGPSVMKVDGSTVQMWFCGGGGSLPGDSIFYSISSQYGVTGTWSTPIEVLRPSPNSAFLDSYHACDPSVAQFDSYYYITYTGATNWGAGTCSGADGGCDNRIFAARVPVWAASNPIAYEKLVNVGNAYTAQPGWRGPAWGDWNSGNTHPPIPVIRPESGLVWQKSGVGGTTIQTNIYGKGQPSLLNLGATRVWFTDQTSAYNGVRTCWMPWQNVHSASAWTSICNSNNMASNAGNHVNYDIAWFAAGNRYAATVGLQTSDSTGRPIVHMADDTGVNPTPDPFISRNLTFQGEPKYLNAETNSHNTGFLRDNIGQLVTMRGSSSSMNEYYWVYYGNNFTYGPTQWNINRVPFSIQ